MPDAYSIESKLDGVDGARKPYPYRLVDLDRTFKVGDGDANGDPNIESLPPTPSAFDHVTKMARVLTKRYEHDGKKLDVAEMLAVILEKLDALEKKL